MAQLFLRLEDVLKTRLFRLSFEVAIVGHPDSRAGFLQKFAQALPSSSPALSTSTRRQEKTDRAIRGSATFTVHSFAVAGGCKPLSQIFNPQSRSPRKCR